MSVSYQAVPLYGICIQKDRLVKKVKNPLWGKHKFDPQTGVKIEKFVTKEENFEAIAASQSLSVMENDCFVYFGIRMADRPLDLNRDFHMQFKMPHTNKQMAVDSRLISVCRILDIPPMESKLCLVANVS